MGGAIPAISMRGFGGIRVRDVEEGAEDAALPGRFGPTNCAKGASSESESSDVVVEDDEEEEARRVVLGAGFAGAAAENKLGYEAVHQSDDIPGFPCC